MVEVTDSQRRVNQDVGAQIVGLAKNDYLSQTAYGFVPAHTIGSMSQYAMSLLNPHCQKYCRQRRVAYMYEIWFAPDPHRTFTKYSRSRKSFPRVSYHVPTPQQLIIHEKDTVQGAPTTAQ